MCIIMRTVRIGDIKCILAIDTKTPHTASYIGKNTTHACIIYVALSSTRTNTNSTMKLCMHGRGAYTPSSVLQTSSKLCNHTPDSLSTVELNTLDSSFNELSKDGEVTFVLTLLRVVL